MEQFCVGLLLQSTTLLQTQLRRTQRRSCSPWPELHLRYGTLLRDVRALEVTPSRTGESTLPLPCLHIAGSIGVGWRPLL